MAAPVMLFSVEKMFVKSPASMYRFGCGRSADSFTRDTRSWYASRFVA